VDALSELGVRFVGLDSSSPSDSDGHQHLVATAEALGSVDVDGTPLVFDIGDDGSGLDSTVIDAIKTLADRVKFDVDAIVEDVAGDALDGRDLVRSIRPLAAFPSTGVDAIEEDSFRGVLPGTRVTFVLTLRNDRIVPTDEPQIVPIRVVFRGDSRSRLSSTDLDIVIPSRDGDGCPTDSLQ
jgi:hypothetical protein